MEEIKVGDYVRTPKQGIFIISHINIPFEDDDKNKVCLCQNSKVVFISINIIKQLKHSKDIIDLIEEGDYVNGKEVIEVFGDSVLILSYIETEVDNIEQLYINQIKSIVTKEQIKQIEFRIKE